MRRSSCLDACVDAAAGTSRGGFAVRPGLFLIVALYILWALFAAPAWAAAQTVQDLSLIHI